MGTPQKQFGQSLESPYAKHLPQYPSQAEGFVPNDFGGKHRVSSSTPSKKPYQCNNYQANANQWRRGNNRYFNANRGSGNGGYRNNNPNNCNQQQTHRHGHSGNRQQAFHGQKFNKSEGNSRNDYYHPSMLMDPWKELLERHNAIRNSQINDPSSTSTHKDQPASPLGESSPTKDAISSAVRTTTTSPPKELLPSI